MTILKFRRLWSGLLLIIFFLPQIILFPVVAAGGTARFDDPAAGSSVVEEPVQPAETRAQEETPGLAHSRDLWVLAQAINGEARGEPYTGKVAVGAVILNRTRDPEFPKTIPEVVYQPDAFTAVNDGQINLPVEPESMVAARDALKGWDPTGGAVYYYNPAKATNRWIWTRKVVLRIGNHLFAN